MIRIEITYGVVSLSFTDSSQGRRYHFDEIGERRFFIDAVSPEGRDGLWEGASYDEAIVTAEAMATEFNGEVVDLVVS